MSQPSPFTPLTELPATTGLVAVNSPGFVHAAFACLRAGEVFSPLRGKNDEQRTRLLSPQRIVEPEAGSGWVTEQPLTDRSERIAQVMFTSGTEGTPKGVLLTHRGLHDVVSRLDGVMHLDASIREYVGVPVYHSFGFGRCRAVAAAGGAFFIPERGFNPVEIASMLQNGSINAISAVPSLWRVLMEAHVVSAELGRKVRWIEIGSQYMSRAEKEQLRTLFPAAAIVQHYGLTEASRSTFLEIHAVEGEALESVGRATGAVEVRLTADGRIAIRGPHVAAGTLVDGKLAASADADGWLETNDLGDLRDGFLYYLGRADDIINCGGLKLPPEALEARVRASLNIPPDFAIFRAPDRLRGDGIVVAALPTINVTDSALSEATALAAQDLGVNARGAIRVIRLDELPTTASGKVQRRALTEQAAKERPPESISPQSLVAAQANVSAIYAKYLGARAAAPSATFTTLGGDSLAFIQTSVALEALLGRLPPRWEEVSIAELEQLPKTKSGLGQLEPMVWLRAIAISVIISNHAHALGELNFAGGAWLLLILSGGSFARFQLQRVIREGRTLPILSGLPKLLIPAVGLQLLQQVLFRHFDLSPVLLFSNFVSPKLDGFWFVEVWVQIYLAVFLIFTAVPVAKLARARPFATALAFLTLGVGMRAFVPVVWDTSATLYDRLPHLKFWLFALGWAISVARGKERFFVSAIAVVLAVWQYSFDPVQVAWVALGSLALTWLPAVRVPSALARAVAWVSASSLYIYIAQYHFFRIARVLLPSSIEGVAGWILAIIGGGLLREAADRAWPWLTALYARRIAERPAGVPSVNG